MKKISKYSLIVIVTLILPVLAVGVIVKFNQKQTIEHMIEATKASYEMKGFEQYYEDYIDVVKLVESYKDTLQKEEFPCLLVDSYKSKITVSTTSKELELSSQQKESFKSIVKSFDSTLATVSLGSVWVDDNMISFRASNGQYALIYTYDDSTPQYIWDESKQHIVNKIRPNWYNVTVDLG